MRALITLLGALLINAGSHAATCDEAKLRDLICELRPGYSPIAFKNPNGVYSKPECSSANVNRQRNQILKLFRDSDTPDALKNEMCRLANIFVLPDGFTESWGKYEDKRYNQNGYNVPAKLGDGNSYVFLHKEVFDDVGFEGLLNKRLGELEGKNGKLSALNPKHKHGPKGLKQKELMQLSLISTIAHEIGHIKYHRDQVIDSPCFVEKIDEASWEVGSLDHERWRAFGDEVGARKHGVPKPSDVDSVDTLAKIYNGGFSTALAAASPEEDYVETYTLAVLKAFSTDDLDLDLDNGRVVVKLKERASDQRLERKLGCVLSIAQPSIAPTHPRPQRRGYDPNNPPRRQFWMR